MAENEAKNTFHEPEPTGIAVDAHFTGILLCNRVPGLRYTASTSSYRIIASRSNIGEKFIVHFLRRTATGPSPIAGLVAGRDRESIERCIIDAINKPSTLVFAQRRPREKPLRQGSRAADGPQITAAKQLEGPAVNSSWPPIPSPDEPLSAVNVKIVAEGRIYRMTTRDFTVGAWRRDLSDNFALSVVRHGSGECRRKIVGDNLESVYEFISLALRSRHIAFWTKPAKPLAIPPELWAMKRKNTSTKIKGKKKLKPKAGPRIVRARRDDA